MHREAATPARSDHCESTLRHLDSYIVSQVHRVGCYYVRDIRPEVLDLELDEVVQRVRIKLWQAIEKREIHYPYAYIKLIIQSEFIDMIRRQRPFRWVSIDQEQTRAEVERAAWSMVDPEEKLAQEMDGSTSLKEMIQAVLDLPPRQQFAMICLLKDRVDDLRQLIEAFKAHKMDIQAIQWPTGKAERQLLHASLVPAKKTLAKKLGPSFTRFTGQATAS